MANEESATPRDASGFRPGFSQTGDTIARFPLTAPFEQFHPFKALEHVAFCAGSAGSAQTSML
jgi:hypothetical protein